MKNCMENERLKQYLTSITPANSSVFTECKNRWNSIAKPLNGLGKLEELICQIGAIRENVDAPVAKKCAIIVCADNGVVSEGISQTDESITTLVATNLAEGRANVNIMGSVSNTKVFSVNIGMKQECNHPDVINRCVRKGTDNIAIGPAMSKEECVQAILHGIELVEYVKNLGYDLIASGEMGIGNTTTSSALASVLLDVEVESVTGKGAGLSDAGLLHKIEVIKKAIAVNKPDRNDPIDLISKIGGLDIAAMTGLFLGGAVYHVPIIIDGLISGVAALLATMLSVNCKDYMIASHCGKEPACRRVLEKLDKQAFIHADLALGEGTGAVALFPLIDIAHKVYSQNITFEDIHMDAYQPL